MWLHQLLDESVRLRAGEPAIVEGRDGATIDYERLGRLSDRVRDRLVALGVAPGDRVGIYLRKSAEAVASIFGILKAGGVYVPVDPTAPAVRNAFIHHDCAVKVAIVERAFAEDYRSEMSELGTLPEFIVVDGTGQGVHLEAALDRLDQDAPAPAAATIESAPDDLAYILYTSGSTGKPKGVMLTHENATAFVDWASRVFEPQGSDVFSSHAPFHFDLSILDIYLSLKHGARLVLISAEDGKDPRGLAELIERHRITNWYSAPSTLSLLAQFGKLPERDLSCLRTVLFAGEVFPVAHLRAFKNLVPGPRYFNLYGPTETNVCTWYEIPETIPDDRVDPYPIGVTCDHLSSIVVDPAGREVDRGDEGELCIAGPNVLPGYWGLPERTAECFLPVDGAERWYRTGDIVVEQPDGNYRYVGRRDRMVKKRGYRVELGEIEACLYRHPALSEAAVVASTDDPAGVTVTAHLAARGAERPSLIELKTFCAQYLPVYMVPDGFTWHDALPKTSTNKIDYQSLGRSN